VVVLTASPQPLFGVTQTIDKVDWQGTEQANPIQRYAAINPQLIAKGQRTRFRFFRFPIFLYPFLSFMEGFWRSVPVSKLNNPRNRPPVL